MAGGDRAMTRSSSLRSDVGDQDLREREGSLICFFSFFLYTLSCLVTGEQFVYPNQPRLRVYSTDSVESGRFNCELAESTPNLVRFVDDWVESTDL